MMKATCIAILAILLLMRVQASAPSVPLMLVAPSDIRWEPTSRPDSTRGSLWGGPAKGPFAYFSRYNGGWQLPPHYHSNQLSGVIASGTFVIHVDGQEPKKLPSGSYFSVPGKTRHTDACLPGPPCVVYFTGDEPLDRIDVTGGPN
jgi:ChrR-like protein with cupin domain